jgi:signal transduction histidine kinase
LKRKRKFFSGKSLFLKYLNVSVIIVFLSFLILGIILTMTISGYWYNEKHNDLSLRAENVADYIHTNVRAKRTPDNRTELEWINPNQSEYMSSFLHIYAGDLDSDIIVLDHTGKILMSVSDNAKLAPGTFMHSDTLAALINNNNYFEKGTLGGIYSEERYISARSIYPKNSAAAAGTVIITTNTKDIDSFTGMVMRIFILSAIATLSMSILAIGVFSYNMVRPLRQMSEAAKRFGKGDFSVRVNATGNDEIKELASAFNNMADSLSASEITRKSFIANVSHELKTPMTTIAGFIDGILDGTIPRDKQDYYLHIVSDEIKRLSRLVRSMLDLSRIDSGELKLNYQSFDLLGVLVNVILTFEQEINRKHIEIRGLDTITPKTVYGDKDLLHQVVYNLIENAVKFTNEGGYIEFNIIESQEQTNFIVKNSGMGIGKSEIDLVFGRFYKTDKSRSKDKKGLGLGLYLVRSIIRLHGGNITAKSIVGEYTEFDFYLPKKRIDNKKSDNKKGVRRDKNG